jgi:hypothetical protein
MLRRSRLSWLLFVAGALLLAKGSFALYPYLVSSANTEVSTIQHRGPDGARFTPGTALFHLTLPRINAGFTIVEGPMTPPSARGQDIWKAVRFQAKRGTL